MVHEYDKQLDVAKIVATERLFAVVSAGNLGRNIATKMHIPSGVIEEIMKSTTLR